MKSLRWVLLVLSLPACLQAATLEESSMRSYEGFQSPAYTVIFTQARELTHLESSRALMAFSTKKPRVPTAQINIAPLLDRHWKLENLTVPISGSKVYISADINRHKDLFLSVMPEKWEEPQFFDVHHLIKKPAELDMGDSKYQVSAKAHKWTPLNSEVFFKSVDGTDAHQITLRKVVEAISQGGEGANLSDQSYRVYYARDVREGRDDKTVNSDLKNIIFMYRNSEGVDWENPYLIPPEKLQTDKMYVTHLHDDRRVGFLLDGDTLNMFENP